MVDAYTALEISQAVGVIVVGIGSAWYSRRAAVLSRPTGNGWGQLVIDDLRDIKTRLARVEEKIDARD